MTETKAKNATCTKDGNNAYYTCDKCLGVFTDEQGTNPTTVEAQTIPATGHTIVYVHIPRTCEKGACKQKKCDKCNTVFEETILEGSTPLGHKNVNRHYATCTEGGYTETNCDRVYEGEDALIQIYDETDSTLLYTDVLDRCGFVEKVYYENEPALGHLVDPNGWYEKDETKATCVLGGLEYNKCSRCDEIISRETDPLGHSGIVTSGYPPKCNEDGVKIYRCGRCGEELKRETIPASHSVSTLYTLKPTCTKTGLLVQCCSICTSNKNLEVGDWVKTGVKIDRIKKGTSATITSINQDQTYTLRIQRTSEELLFVTYERGEFNTSSDAEPAVGDQVTTSTGISAIDENAGVTISSINDNDGSFMLRYQTEKRTITARYTTGQFTTPTILSVTETPKTEHKFTLQIEQERTCTRKGIYIYSGTCTDCGAPYEGEPRIEVDPLGHQPQSGKEPTCLESVPCTRCQGVAIAALGHDFRVPGCVLSNGSVNGFYCQRCGSLPATTDDKAATIAALMNLVKSDSGIKAITAYHKRKMFTSYTKFDFGIYTSQVKKIWETYMPSSTIEYDNPENGTILALFPHAYNPNYSIKTNQGFGEKDLDYIKIERIEGFNTHSLLTGFNETAEGVTAPDISAYDNRTVSEKVIKVTLDIRNEVYSKAPYAEDSTVNNVNPASVMNGNTKSYLYETHISKVCDYDIRKMVDTAGFPADTWTVHEGGSEEGYEMQMKLNSVKADAKVVYYLAADDYEPIAATYHITDTMDQDLEVVILSFKGNIKPIISTERDNVYFFNDYFNS